MAQLIAALRAQADREIADKRRDSAGALAQAEAEAREYTQKMVADAEAQTAAAEQRLAEAIDRAESLTATSQEESSDLLNSSREEAERILALAREASGSRG